MAAETYLERKKKSREKRDETYDARKKKALSEGKKVLFITCPLCGRGRPLKIQGKKQVRFVVKPDYFLVQARYGAGRGSGFFLRDDESLSVADVKKHYPALYKNLKESIGELAKIFK
jgi:hypothetical protein